MIVRLLVIVLILVGGLIWWWQDQLRVWWMNFLIVSRGIFATNCFWFGVSDRFLADGSGVELYRKYLERIHSGGLRGSDDQLKRDGMIRLKMFDQPVYLVINLPEIEYILENSPNLFQVGKLKNRFFQSFMAKNLGVSSGCPWNKRRKANEYALMSEREPDWEVIDGAKLVIGKALDSVLENSFGQVGSLDYDWFSSLGRRMVEQVVFGVSEGELHPVVFDIFSQANDIGFFLFDDYQLDSKMIEGYRSEVKRIISLGVRRNLSLLGRLLMAENDLEEILHQIPHFIFPIVGLFSSGLSRFWLLLANHPQVYHKLKQELQTASFDGRVLVKPGTYLRACLMELFRLNNPVITTFRTLSQDWEINGEKFQQGDQFLILNNPVLRDSRYWGSDPDQFRPERWLEDWGLEQKGFAISFNQGPQRCPGKELALSLLGMTTYLALERFDLVTDQSLNKMKIEQAINPCQIKLKFVPKRS